jgi:tetratricopeptide (TPR) repeat protein
MIPGQSEFQQGKQAFEAGQYRSAVQLLEQALAWVDAGTPLHGDVQVWLVTAYEAAGDREQARELCKAAVRHPQWETRKSAKRLLYILEAPALRKREDWLTQIPDLEKLESNDDRNWGTPALQTTSRKPKEKPPEGYQIPPPTDPTQVETEDRLFVWVVLGGIAIVLGGLFLAM